MCNEEYHSEGIPEEAINNTQERKASREDNLKSKKIKWLDKNTMKNLKETEV